MSVVEHLVALHRTGPGLYLSPPGPPLLLVVAEPGEAKSPWSLSGLRFRSSPGQCTEAPGRGSQLPPGSCNRADVRLAEVHAAQEAWVFGPKAARRCVRAAVRVA